VVAVAWPSSIADASVEPSSGQHGHPSHRAIVTRPCACATIEAVDVIELIAKQEIHEVLMRFLRGMDRQDWAAVRACFHPGAIHDHGTWRGSIEEFIEREKSVYERFVVNTHFAGNELIAVDGDTATSELYSVCWHRVAAEPGGTEVDWLAAMRFLDRFERRDGEWRIADRVVAIDWTRHDAVTAP
jgi:hypothetical protein